MIGRIFCLLWSHHWQAAVQDNGRGRIRLYCTRCAKFSLTRSDQT